MRYLYTITKFIRLLLFCSFLCSVYAKDQGIIVILNGTSSAGKTSLAQALIRISQNQFTYVSRDNFVEKKFFPIISNYHNEKCPNEPKPHDFSSIRGFCQRHKNAIDPLWNECVVRGLPQHITKLASCNQDVVVDHMLSYDNEFKAFVTLLHNYHVIFVKVFCPAQIAEQREIARGDREIGTAAKQYPRVHHYKGSKKHYDLEIDTSQNSPEKCALHIINFLKNNPPLGALDQNYALIQNRENVQ